MRSLFLTSRAAKDLRQLDQDTQRRFLEAFHKWANHREGDVRPLAGRPGDFRLRVGKYRAIFHLDTPGVITVFRIDNRGQVY